MVYNKVYKFALSISTLFVSSGASSTMPARNWKQKEVVLFIYLKPYK